MSKITTYREKHNLTQIELAKKSGLSVRTIQRIEAGATLKGHSLNVLAKALGVEKDKLKEVTDEPVFNYKLIKFINISSLPFVIIPLANIIVPLLIMYFKKEMNSITKQIVSIQILWTILSSILFFLSPFIGKLILLQNKLILIVLIVSILINVFIILRNTSSLDTKQKLSIYLKFSFL